MAAGQASVKLLVLMEAGGARYRMLETVRAYGGPDWFNLGDRDLATHVLRSERLGHG